MASVRVTPMIIRCVLALALFNTANALHAGFVRTRDGKTMEGQVSFNSAGALVVTRSNGEQATNDLREVVSASFAPGSFFSSGSILPSGWTVADIGDVRGAARLDTNTFTLRVEGNTTNALACHYVSRAMPSDGDLTMKVEEVSGTGVTHGGIMIRGNNSSIFAALSVGGDGKLWFQSRPDSDKKTVILREGPQVKTPILLRLQKKEKTVTALYSYDAKSWETFVTEQLKISLEKTWRDNEGELHLLRASCGVFASSRGVDTRATVRASALFLTQNGLLGEYFSDPDFGNLKMARLDPQVRFNWRSGSPDSSIADDHFSVRWTGKLMPRRFGTYAFFLDADSSAKLWIDDKEIVTSRFKRKSGDAEPTPVPLTGRPTEVKLEFTAGAEEAEVKLGWSLWQNQDKPEVVGMTNFLYVLTGAKSPESIALARLTNAGPAVRGVLLRNGSFIASAVTKADESAVRFAFGGRKEMPLLNNRVARIFLRPPRQALAYEIAHGRSGVFMKNGDFLECEFRGVDHHTLTVNSLLFGMKRYGIEGSGPLVVVLNDVAAKDAGYEVRLLDGSAFRAQKLGATAETIALHDSILGELTFPTSELVEIRQLGVRAGDTAFATP